MGKTVVVVPAVVVVIAPIGWNMFFQEFLQILDQTRLILDSCQRRGGAVDEQRRRAVAHAYGADLLLQFSGDVDDVAAAGGGFGDRLGVNRDHASNRPVAADTN